MSDSDGDCYENLGESFSPPTHKFSLKPRSMTHTGVNDQWKSNSHVPPNIDKRPPYPVPKTARLIGETPGLLNYDRITVSPVAPDYELSSASQPQNGHHNPSTSPPQQNGHHVSSTSPPRNEYHIPSMSPTRTGYGVPFSNDHRPPLPPMNPNRRPPTR